MNYQEEGNNKDQPVVQFVLDVPSYWEDFITAHFDQTLSHLASALASIFNVEPGVVCRVSCNYGHRLQLVEVNGQVGREAHPLEVQGALKAVFGILAQRVKVVLV